MDLNELRSSLCINGLENVESNKQAVAANLSAKEQLAELTLNWDGASCCPEDESEVLESLCPPIYGLKHYVSRTRKVQGTQIGWWVRGMVAQGTYMNLLSSDAPDWDLLLKFLSFSFISVNSTFPNAMTGTTYQKM